MMSLWSCRTQSCCIPRRTQEMHTPSMIMESSKISLVRRNHRLRLNTCMEAPMVPHLSGRAQMREERLRCTCASGSENKSSRLCMRGSRVFFINISSFCVCLDRWPWTYSRKTWGFSETLIWCGRLGLLISILRSHLIVCAAGGYKKYWMHVSLVFGGGTLFAGYF